MPTDENQSSELKNQQLTRDIDEQSKSVDESRRLFVKSSFVVSGVMLTLASRPAFGWGGICQAPSGFVSGNVSSHGHQTTCIGCKPSYWCDHPSEWPSDYQTGKCDSHKLGGSRNPDNWSGGTLFRKDFNCSGQGRIYYDKTHMQVCVGVPGDSYQLGSHIMAACLNAKKGYTPVLQEAQVKNMFNEWCLRGYFEPTAGVRWYAEDIVAYLQTTMR